ncbi:transglycosylase domain-containing protein [Syntrophomonas erecta]
MRKTISLIIIMGILITTSGFGISLPEIEVPESSVLFDINGRVIKGLAEQNRISITLEEIPPEFRSAIIAVEDKNFYHHHGVDIAGILRAVFVNLKERKIAAGGSTITQQTAKNLFLTNERTLMRKLKELIYAIELERRYSKDEILTMYCNTIYFGHGAYGIEVAARTFFGKSSKELTLAEATLLAGLPQWPGEYDPYLNPDKAKNRQAIVLQRMVEENMITSTQKSEVLAEPLNYKQAGFLVGDAPYFVDMVKNYLIKKYGERMVFQGGLRVYTTLDLDMQQAANQAYEQGMAERDPAMQAALVAMDPRNGQVRALVGGRDYAVSSYNRAFARRQPGSTFKPFVYSLAIAYGFTPADQIMCEEVEYKLSNGDVYRPTDYGEKPYHWRKFTLKEAIMKSDNVVAVRINHILGPKESAGYAQHFGFNNLQPVLSLPLGSNEVTPMSMATAYSVFANKGIYSEPGYVIKVEDKRGRVLEENRLQQKQAIKEDNAYIITDMLKGVMEPGGTGSRLKSAVGAPVAGKTGTTDEFKDAWFVGFTPHICCAVWVGYDRNQNVNLTGGVAAGPIWAQFMGSAVQKLGARDFERPANVELLSVCLDSGMIACESCPRVVEMAFIKGTQPQDVCYEHAPHLDWLLPGQDSNSSSQNWWEKWVQ